MSKKCEVSDCAGESYGFGLCRKHHARLKRGKNPHEKSRFEKTKEERLDEKYEVITESGCWIWTGAISDTGYGSINGENAHRAMYERYKGAIPPGMFVLHSCDVRCCVNPAHLSVGSQQDNMDDAVRKGRVAFGDRLPQYKHGKYATHCAVGA